MERWKVARSIPSSSRTLNMLLQANPKKEPSPGLAPCGKHRYLSSFLVVWRDATSTRFSGPQLLQPGFWDTYLIIRNNNKKRWDPDNRPDLLLLLLLLFSFYLSPLFLRLQLGRRSFVLSFDPELLE